MTDPIYKGLALPRTAGVIDTVAEDLGVPTAALQAVIVVEARSSGFYADGRLVMLPEAHIAYRYSRGEVRDQLVKAKLAAPYGKLKYPYSVNARYSRFDRIAEIGGLELACKSCSWGLPQGMGFNYAPFGYASATDMVQSFAVSEDNQLVAMGRFIRANEAMHRALIRRDWKAFAYAYNGSGYRVNRYDERLAAAFYEANKNSVFIRKTVRMSDKGNDVRVVQEALARHGYKVHPDGDFGKVTLQAVREFQDASGLHPDGIVGPKTAEALGITIGV